MSVQESYESDSREVYKLTPGIVEAVEKYQGDTLRAKHLDLPYENTKIGAALNVLSEKDVLQPVQTSGKRPNLYTKTESSFEELHLQAEQLFQDRIDNAFNLNSLNINHVLEDLEEKGVHTAEYSGGPELAKFPNNDYHSDTLRFLNQLNIIKTTENREITAPETDIEFVEQNYGRDIQDF